MALVGRWKVGPTLRRRHREAGVTLRPVRAPGASARPPACLPARLICPPARPTRRTIPPARQVRPPARPPHARPLPRPARLPGPGPAPSGVGYDALTGRLDEFGFEDWIGGPPGESEAAPPDTHSQMEAKLGLGTARVERAV